MYLLMISVEKSEVGSTEMLTLTLFPHACVPTRCLSSLDELVTLRKTFPVERILMSMADVADAFRIVRVDSDQAHNFARQEEIWL